MMSLTENQVKRMVGELAGEREPLTKTQLMNLLRGIDPETKRLPIGLYHFARAIEKAHGIGGEE